MWFRANLSSLAAKYQTGSWVAYRYNTTIIDNTQHAPRSYSDRCSSTLNTCDFLKRNRSQKKKKRRKEGGAGNFDFQLASRFLSKSKPPEIHLLAQT
jgi:hypothetical protein